MGKVNNQGFNLNKREINFILNKLGIDNILDIDVAILKRLKENLKAIIKTKNSKKSAFFVKKFLTFVLKYVIIYM